MIDDAIHQRMLQRRVERAPRDVLGLEKLGSDWQSASWRSASVNLQGRPDGTPPFEDLDEHAMAVRLAEKLAERDRLQVDAAYSRRAANVIDDRTAEAPRRPRRRGPCAGGGWAEIPSRG